MLQIYGSSINLLLSMNVAESQEINIINSGNDCENKTVKKSIFKNSNKVVGYLIPKTRSTFTQLRKVFIKVLVLGHFDLKFHIRIKTDVSGYAISIMLNLLIDLDKWHLVIYNL